MGRAAGDGAAGGQAIFAARGAADPPTLEQVRAALVDQLSGTLPAASAPWLAGQPGYLDRRTFVPLSYIRTDAR